MSPELFRVFWPYLVAIVMLAVSGLYCVLASFNLIRCLIGVELLLKAVSLLVIVVGFVTGRQALAQSLVITFIVIEVVVMTVALGVVMNIQRYNKSLDMRDIKNVQ
jgi:multisubunit Na+/H+ antiporter MnhC subunit